MSRALSVTFPALPRSTNNLYWNVQGRGRVLSREARAWKDAAILIAQAAASSAGFTPAPRTPLRIEITFTSPRVLTFDLDGKLKAPIDAVCQAIGVDDRHIMELRATKARGPEAVQIVVTALED